MARYALGIVGAAIGFVVGGPVGMQIGFALGSYAGAVIDPMVTKGPALGDANNQTSRDGVPIPIGWGLAHMVGNIIAINPYVDDVEEEGSKKAVQEINVRFQTFAIGIGRGPAGPIVGLLRCWENNKLIYDVRPESNWGVIASDPGYIDNKLFEANTNLYLGTETQDPDPELESNFGVGTTPSYRGLAYIVFVDKKISDFGNSIPLYRFEICYGLATSEENPEYPPSPECTVWLIEMTSTPDLFTLPLRNFNGAYPMYFFQYDFVVNWGDGTPPDHITAWDQAEKTHEYAEPGFYKITMCGLIEHFNFRNNELNSSRGRLKEIQQWGDTGIVNWSDSFYGCNYLSLTAIDSPKFDSLVGWYDYDGSSNWNETSNMFTQCWNVTDGIAHWDLTGLTSCFAMFYQCLFLEEADLTGWDVSNIEDMVSMFRDCQVFDADLTGWDTSNVGIDDANKSQGFSNMFYNCDQFTGKGLGTWDVGNSHHFNGMFLNCYVFNEDIGDWDTSKAESMLDMFRECTIFNQNISATASSWDTSNVTSMGSMFRGAQAFNQGSLATWDYSSCIQLDAFLYQAYAYTTADYDNLLEKWHDDCVAGGMGTYLAPFIYPAHGTFGKTFYDVLQADPYFWTITDGGGP